MQEKTLFHIALVTAVVGVLGLLILSQVASYDLTAIADIDSSIIEKTVRVQGEIISASISTSTYHLLIQDETGRIAVDVYADEKPYSFEENSGINVLGRVVDYQGELRIQAEKITALDVL